MSSKRTFRRKVQKERERLARLLAGTTFEPEESTDDTSISSDAEVPLKTEEIICDKNVYSYAQYPTEIMPEQQHNEILKLLGELNRKMDCLSGDL